ncbi:hypothetical protein IWW38_002840 [Coemansia aciculifera]|uniref:Uncharacterized protein n=1 Tax=Coemansia aciculifera TaxID=417176 RepID=A0ACC1M303_9FUNG|nr:hypothetical protein IWW38_002840 [Coemansia aciculifera]
MAGGRRRRSNTNGSESALSAPIPLEVVPEDSVSTHEDDESVLLTAGRNPAVPGLEDADDPFAYDSDLETLSSVSSHSSISSSSSSALDLALDQADAMDQQQQLHADCSVEDDGDVEMTSAQEGGDQDTGDENEESGDAEDLGAHGNERYKATAGKSNNEDETSEKAESDSEQSGDEEAEARYLSKPGIISASASTAALARSRGASSTSLKRQNKYAAYRLANGEDGDVEDEGADASDSQGRCSALDTPDTCESGAVKSAGSRSSKRKRPSETDADSEDNDVSQSGVGDGEEEEVAQGEMEAGEDSVANEARRSEALVELTGIEIEFAKLRERLYSERLQQVQIEEEHLVAGQHIEYERHIEDISASFAEQMERLQAAHEVWLAHRQKMHEAWQSSVTYTYLTQRQELRSRLLAAQKKRIWRLRDTRVQDNRRRAERASALRMNGSGIVDELTLIAQQQQATSIRLLKRERRAATTAQKCLVHMRQHRLAVSGLDADEMDADYLAMNLPVYAREQKDGAFRRLYVPAPQTTEVEPSAGKKRKPRQPRQPKKRKLEDGAGPPPSNEAATKGNAKPATTQPAAVSKSAVVPSAQEPKAASANGAVTAKQATGAVPATTAATTAVRPGLQMMGSGQPRGGATGHATRPGAKAVGRPPPLNLPVPHGLHGGTGRVQPAALGASSRPAVGGGPVVVSTAQPVVAAAGESASSDDTGTRSSVDMHVPTGNGGPLGLRV